MPTSSAWTVGVDMKNTEAIVTLRYKERAMKILDFGLRIGGIASLWLYEAWFSNLKSKIRNSKFEIDMFFIPKSEFQNPNYEIILR